MTFERTTDQAHGPSRPGGAAAARRTRGAGAVCGRRHVGHDPATHAAGRGGDGRRAGGPRPPPRGRRADRLPPGRPGRAGTLPGRQADPASATRRAPCKAVESGGHRRPLLQRPAVHSDSAGRRITARVGLGSRPPALLPRRHPRLGDARAAARAWDLGARRQAALSTTAASPAIWLCSPPQTCSQSVVDAGIRDPVERARPDLAPPTMPACASTPRCFEAFCWLVPSRSVRLPDRQLALRAGDRGCESASDLRSCADARRSARRAPVGSGWTVPFASPLYNRRVSHERHVEPAAGSGIVPDATPDPGATVRA